MKDLLHLPKNFKEEEKVLHSLNIHSWSAIKNLKDNEINKIAKKTLSTSRNLIRLRCIAMLISELEISQSDAGLLMHSGVASVEALAKSTPQELSNKIGRLERLLKTGRKNIFDLQKANSLIKKARNKQINR